MLCLELNGLTLFDCLYSEGYLDLLKKTAVGIQVRSQAAKFTFFTNHRSLKEAKTKPYKTELLVNPQYTVYVKSTDEVNQALLDRLKDNQFVFSPMLGHAYCPARIPRFSEIVGVKEVEPEGLHVSTVFLDEVVESKSRNPGVQFDLILGFPAKILLSVICIIMMLRVQQRLWYFATIFRFLKMEKTQF